MKRYKDYMDAVEVSDTLHEKLKNLKEPKKKPQLWKGLGAMAAVMALIVGTGVGTALWNGGGWPADNPVLWEKIIDHFKPAAGTVAPEIADVPGPDIATEDPNAPFVDPMPGLGGYEVVHGDVNDPNTMVSYYFLPYIEYGMAKNRSEMALDWDVPRGSTRRDLIRADIAALFGGEKTLSDHLAWGDYELSGWAAWYGDGSLWGAFINGYKGEQDRFEFAFVTGDRYPPTCIMYGDGETQGIFDLTVTAWGYDGPNGCDRRVEFLNDGCGFRFDVTAADREQAAWLVSRLVRWVATEGLAQGALTSDGAVLSHPWEAEPGWSVGEPNWEDGVPDEDSGSFDPDCPYCADGTVHTHAYDPSASG